MSDLARIEVSPDRLLRLDKPGPRYTSYPTVPVWRDDLPDGAWRASLASVRPPVSVYVHIPFCREQCTFCGCNMVVSGLARAGDRYLDALERQIDGLTLPSERVGAARIHLGGGTPTWLNVGQLRRLYAMLFTRFEPVSGAELSVEVDPDVTSDEQVALLHELGVNRLSLGVQSFDPAVLAAINRPQEGDRITRITEQSRGYGMRGLNLDLIYGLPLQTRASLRATLDDVLALRPDRLAIYSFAHVPWAKPHQRKIDPDTLPGPAEKLGLYLLALEVLTDAGYQAIGMDHFALPEDELAVAQREERLHRNFMGYTTHADLELVGLGMSAISELAGVYAQQQPGLGRWYRAVEKGEGLVEKGCTLTAEDRLRREVIERLMCNFLVPFAVVGERHGVDFERHFARELANLAPLEEEGLVERHPGRIVVTPLGRLFVRNVAMAFDAYLDRGGRFSRTV